MIETLSIFLLFLFLPIPFVLFVMHAFIHFWRRVGRMSYAVAIAIWPVIGIFILFYREKLLAYDLQFPLLIQAFGLALALGGLILAWVAQRHLTLPVLVGFPELMPRTHRPKLATSRLYARMRHPRYVGYLLILDGWFLVSGYVVFPVVALLLLLVIPLEERELRQRFGQAYAHYMQNVPAFFPRLRAWSPRKR